MMTNEPIPFLSGLSAIAGRYRGILCDVWGVVHNGVRAFEPACEALVKYRAEGGTVVLLTNAPRPSGPIYGQLDGLGVPRDAYDGIVTSGDATRALLLEKGLLRIHHIGPDRDLTLYEDSPMTLVGAEEADVVVCTGLVDDETESPEDYRERLDALVKRGLRFVCANPDIVVERGNTLVWCAGALAREYADLGGEVVILGKPHAPIYANAFARISELAGTALDKSDILAIGDGLKTDVAGAVGQGLDTLFISAGIHAADFGDADNPDQDKVRTRLADEGLAVAAIIPKLAW
ncbi:MAG: TIGR01459 family HAD-type hydrolase [Hyphomicrobiales bacterium]|nr:MAG: TIGR01459 family HAD-type hydrolase [Hyphomicrobiales bacterium]